MGGFTNSDDEGNDYYFVETDEYGNLLLNKTFGGGGSDIIRSILLTKQGNYVIHNQFMCYIYIYIYRF